jgi:hypothetical protein
MQAQDGLKAPAPSELYAANLSYQAAGVGDALVGGTSLPVDAVGVDLEQDRYAVPGVAGDLGGWHLGVQPQGHRCALQVVGAAAQLRPALRFGEGLYAGLGTHAL